MFIKKLLPVLLLACGYSSLFAESLTLIPYLTNVGYDKGTKSRANYGGLYGNFDNDDEKFEFEIEGGAFETNTPKTAYKQSDLVLSYSTYLSDDYIGRAAFHYIASNYVPTDNAQIYLIGFTYIHNDLLELGANGSASRYSNGNYATSVLQLQPYVGFHFGNYYSRYGLWYAQFNYYLSHPRNSDPQIDYSYTSYELSLKQMISDFTNYVSAWVGKQFYGVRENGFSVFNLEEVHNGGFALSSRYRLSDEMGVKFSYLYEDFQDIPTSANTLMNKYVVSLDFTF